MATDPNRPLTYDELEDLKSMGYTQGRNGHLIGPSISLASDTTARERSPDAHASGESLTTRIDAATTTRGRVQLVRADTIEPEHVDYLDDPLIPLRVVTLVVGVDGIGKSTMLYAKAALATRGRLPGSLHGQPSNVVIASCEDHAASVIVPRLIAAGADLSRVSIVEVERDGYAGDISLPDDLPELEQRIGEVEARLLIVDPLVGHMPLNVDSHKAQHIRHVTAPLQRVAEEHHLAVAAVVHFNGAPTNDVRSRISGSKAFSDMARSILVCGVDPSDESRYILVQHKHSTGPKSTTGHGYCIEARTIVYEEEEFKTSRIVWLGDVEMDSRALLGGPDDPEERASQDELVDILRRVLADGTGSMPAAEARRRFATALGEAGLRPIPDRTVDRIRHRAGIKTRRQGFGAGKSWIWELEDEPFSP